MTGEEESTPSPVEIAKNLFDEGRYAECISTLTESETAETPLGTKVQLNVILCDYLKNSSEQDLGELLKKFQALDNKMNAESDEEEVDEVEKAVLLYNMALVHYQTKQYEKAVVILEKLFKLIEPLEEVLSYKICFLLVECYLSTYHTEGAAVVVYYLDKQMSAKSSESGEGGVEMHKARMHQYKTRLFAQQKCLKACKREIKNLLSVCGTTASSLFLKSEFEYLRNNFKKSCKLLNSAPKTCPSKEHIPTLYYNNFGCMHFKMQKYNLGVLYMSQALEANTKAVKSAPQGCNSTMFSINHHYQILYNYGILLLHAGQHKAAFNCLTQAATVYCKNPRLWLRIAECAIGVVKQQQGSEHTCKSNTVKAVVGSGVYRKTILNTPLQHCSEKRSPELYEAPTPSLLYAALCLNNALDLLPYPDSNSGSTQVSALPAPPLKEAAKLRASVLCNLAFVWLGMGDPLQALQPAQELLNLKSAPANLRLLGSVYAAEALILLNRNNEASSCLAPEFVESIIEQNAWQDKVLRGEEEDGSGNSSPDPGKVPGNQEQQTREIHNTIILNSVALYCMKRDLNRAKRILAQHLSTLKDNEVPPQATMLLVYIELRQGNAEAALSILKERQINLPNIST